MLQDVNLFALDQDVKTKTMSKAKLKSISGKLKKASKAHASQSQQLDKVISTMKKIKQSPALKKLSASCKAAAKRKFKVYPSAYANMWAAKTQRQGKC
jgi:septal ring factor EnvC (AmiA/AmiB activator)